MSAGILAVGTADGHLTQDRGEGASYECDRGVALQHRGEKVFPGLWGGVRRSLTRSDGSGSAGVESVRVTNPQRREFIRPRGGVRGG